MGNFASRLKEEREKAGLTQAELAAAANMNRVSVARLESGEREPAWETVEAICDALGVSCDQFRAKSKPAAKSRPPKKK
jgi:transcriptional regulator with XRE-family HTH domain